MGFNLIASLLDRPSNCVAEGRIVLDDDDFAAHVRCSPADIIARACLGDNNLYEECLLSAASFRSNIENVSLNPCPADARKKAVQIARELIGDASGPRPDQGMRQFR